MGSPFCSKRNRNESGYPEGVDKGTDSPFGISQRQESESEARKLVEKRKYRQRPSKRDKNKDENDEPAALAILLPLDAASVLLSTASVVAEAVAVGSG